MYVVDFAVAPHFTTEHGTKELPVTVSVNPAEPAAADVCDNDEITGAGRLAGVVRVKGMELDAAVPDGLVTVIKITLLGFGEAVSAEVIAAVS
jgi:hypothetical protein